MGIEYMMKSEKFDKVKCIQLMSKITSATEASITQRNDVYEFRLSENQHMPDLVIHLEDQGTVITYNGGYMNSWSIVGLFLSLMAEWFGPITLHEV